MVRPYLIGGIIGAFVGAGGALLFPNRQVYSNCLEAKVINIAQMNKIVIGAPISRIPDFYDITLDLEGYGVRRAIVSPDDEKTSYEIRRLRPGDEVCLDKKYLGEILPDFHYDNLLDDTITQ